MREESRVNLNMIPFYIFSIFNPQPLTFLVLLHVSTELYFKNTDFLSLRGRVERARA